MLRRDKKNGQSLIEFLALVLFILAIFLVFQKYIVRGIAGRWKTVGDSIGDGKIYDPNKTIECAFDQQYTLAWYGQIWFENNCEGACLRSSASAAACTACIEGCQTPQCD